MADLKARIIGTGKALPQKILTNADLEKMVQTTDEWIRTRTGILERRIASSAEATSDFAVTAARIALDNAKFSPLDIDLIIVCTCTPDMVFPSVGCIVQSAIGASRAAAMDLSAACSGFVYGLATAKSFIESGMYKVILLIGTDTLSKITNWEDRSTCVLFGDGAGAAILSAQKGESGILSVYLGSDGTRSDILKVPGGGSRAPLCADVLNSKSHTIHMDGQEVYKMAVENMVAASQQALALAHLTQEDLKIIIPHQANLRIINSVAKRLNIKEDKVFVNLQKYGNMSAATTIIALDEAQKSGVISQGDVVELVAFGAGLTWGAAIIRW